MIVLLHTLVDVRSFAMSRAILCVGFLSLSFSIRDVVYSDDAKPDSKQPVGIAKRTLWTTSRVTGSPEPAAPYRTEVAFPKLMRFSEPLVMTAGPGTNRLFVVERRGKIYSFENDSQGEKAELLLDVGKTVYGFVCHPKFKENGFVYVTSIADAENPGPNGSRLARFTVSRDGVWRADPKSERLLLEWPSGGHNGGCLAFGPDGFLYLVTGDGSGIADELQSGQDISDLLASILRIDVDHPDEKRGLAYGIPADNPFVKQAGARPEIWAYGLRQAWKMSFDRQTGDLWAGEIGQDLWESVYRIQRGGNYGWSVNEGTHPFRPERKLGPTPIIKPVHEHPHVDFRSITGGYVYRGSRLKELVGAYIYGDYDTGKVAMLRYDGKQATGQRELVDTPLRIITWAEDAAGELYFVDFMSGGIHRLTPTPPADLARKSDFPRKLSQTGLFASTKDLTPAPGLIPYSVNSELWSDHAIKERFIALPGESKIDFDSIEYPQPAPGAPRGWKFPDGTVLVKSFSLELERGNPASKRRLETRLLHHERTPGTEEVGDQVWHGYTYVWNDDQTDADLVDTAGADRTFTIKDAAAPGGERKQTWHFPSRAECTLCHTMPAKYVLGVNTLQMNKDHTYPGGVVANQLRTLDHLGMFTKPLGESQEKLPHLADHRNAKEPLDARARAYLHSNCSHCHRKWGGGNAEFQLLATQDLKDAGVLNTRPGQGGFNLNDPRILVPGDPDRSMLLHRMTKLGLGRMPHVASTVIDEPAVGLIREWIKQLRE
jgi:uncharacterized repeat protein (TIGR03806 family)